VLVVFLPMFWNGLLILSSMDNQLCVTTQKN